MTFPIFDSHCHLDAEQFDDDRDDVIMRAAEAGVTSIIIPGTELASSRKTVELISRIENIETYGAVGIHPHEAKDVDDTTMQEIERLSHEPGIVAIGETGLDFHYNFSPPEVQQASLRAHVQLAVRRKLPLILHCRNAEPELLHILDEEKANQYGGVVHCYTGTMETAQRLLELGFYLGFTGIVTFRKADELREVVRIVPLDRILLETDSPYLAPIPFRGKRNEPAYVGKVAETVGPLLGKTAEEIASIAAQNTRECFHIN